MARCYYLEWQSRGMWSGDYVCKLCGKHMEEKDAHVKYVCDAEYGDEYKKCPIYKDYA
ncbi:MAG: hypothetical protein NC122_06975 [Faecalibacterium sp.]|nr:hypothetical protein [Ruminococcus sp.]MCM1391185.1 hypothetical protein [Ruminococcus sp.]MCM1485933.1 hypothetical protein [Faecalibacterium sp.]